MQNKYDILKCCKCLRTSIKSNILIFLCSLYLFMSLNEILLSENVKINGIIYLKSSYFFYAFVLPFIFCLFLVFFAFYFFDKNRVRDYLSIFYLVSFAIIGITSFLLMFIAFSSLKTNGFVVGFLSIFYVFCTSYFLNVCAFIGIIYSILNYVPFKIHQFSIPNLNFLVILCLAVLIFCIKLITTSSIPFDFSKILVASLIFAIFCLLNLLSFDKEVHQYPPLGLLLCIISFIVFFPAILFYFFENGCLLKFIFS